MMKFRKNKELKKRRITSPKAHAPKKAHAVWQPVGGKTRTGHFRSLGKFIKEKTTNLDKR